jgi:GrpE
MTTHETSPDGPVKADQVTRISAEGQPFVPRLHEAVSMVPVSDPTQDDHVISVIRAGYAIGDEVLRPATVAVGRLASSARTGHPPAASPGDQPVAPTGWEPTRLALPLA